MKNIVVVGATSAIATRYARAEASLGGRFALIGRSHSKLESVAHDLTVRGSQETCTIAVDFTAVDKYESAVQAAFETLGTVDVVLIAHGMLPEKPLSDLDPMNISNTFQTNATSAVLFMILCARLLERQGSGSLVVISSVAGDRGRASNLLYGSAKAAVTAAASGLRQHLTGSGINVLTIKPGFVDTPMTRNFKKGPLWSSPDKVARGIQWAIERRRGVVYLPCFWWWIMRVITHLPEWIFRRLPL